MTFSYNNYAFTITASKLRLTEQKENHLNHYPFRNELSIMKEFLQQSIFAGTRMAKTMLSFQPAKTRNVFNRMVQLVNFQHRSFIFRNLVSILDRLVVQQQDYNIFHSLIFPRIRKIIVDIRDKNRTTVRTLICVYPPKR